MVNETPLRIAVIGAGPVGLEAGLYGRYLGYTVDIYQRSRVCEQLLHQHGESADRYPFAASVSRLGVAALKAQDANWQLDIESNAALTGAELAECYFLPMASSDLLADSVHTGQTVIAVLRQGPPRDPPDDQHDDEQYDDQEDEHDDGQEAPQQDEQADAPPPHPYTVIVQNWFGEQSRSQVDIVLDASGNSPSFELTQWPGCYVLGKRTSRAAEPAALADYLDQIRAAFAELGGRAGLNLYATF